MAAKNEMTITVRAIDAATTQLKKIDSSVKGTSKSMGEMAKATAIAAASFNLMSRAWGLITAGSKDMERLAKDATETWGELGDKVARVIEKLAAFAVGGPLVDRSKEMQDAIKATREEAERLETVFVYGVKPAMTDDQIRVEWERLNAVLEKTERRLDDVAGIMTDSFLDGIDAMIDGTKNLSDAFRDMVSSILRSLGRLFAQEALSGLFRGLLGWLFGGNPLSQSLGAQGFTPATNVSWIPPMHAAGGPVMGGRPSTVGEMGRETFVPSTSGYIQRGGSGSGDTFNITVVEAKDSRATAQAVMAEIQRHRGFRQALQVT